MAIYIKLYLFIYLSARARCKRLVLDVVVYNSWITGDGLSALANARNASQTLHKRYSLINKRDSFGKLHLKFPFSSFYISNCTEKNCSIQGLCRSHINRFCLGAN